MIRGRFAVLGAVVFTVVASLGAPAGAKGGNNNPPPPPPPPAGPPAPGLVAPANTAQVQEPFTISWSAVSDPKGIQAYNWQVSVSSTFTDTSVVRLDSTMGPTSDIVDGLPHNRAYFWRVQAVNGSFEQGAWSAPRGFTITGAAPNSLGATAMNPPPGGPKFHPMESMSYTWAAVTGAATYRWEASTSPDFPVLSMVLFDNQTEPRAGMAFHDSLQGNWLARVVAVDANGVRGVPSTPISFSVFYTNPIGPAPTIVGPVGNPTTPLPVTVTWNHVPNPQDVGYQVQIATDSGFASIEDDHPQLSGPSFTFISLTAGPKWWRVRSFQGDASPTTAAATAWSTVGTFTIPNTPPTVTGLPFTRTAPFSGDIEDGTVQLSRAAPAGGSTVSLSSSDPNAAPVPASVKVDAGFAVANFSFPTGQVVAAKDVTITASLNGSSIATTIHLQPPSLKELALPSRITGGVATGGPLMLNGTAPASGAVVSLTSDSPAAQPPATVTVPAGSPSTSVAIPTSEVTTDTLVTITATWNGGVIRSQFTLTPPVPPASIVIDPAVTTGTNGSSGVVRIAAPVSTDTAIPLSSSNEAVAFTDKWVTIPAGTTAGSFLIFTRPASASTTVTISASAGGVTKSATVTVNPFPPAPLPAPSLISPANGARPAAGALIAFDWSDVTNAAGYQIQVSTASNFASNAIDRVVTPSQLSAALGAGSYFWRVRARDSAANPGTWSATGSFRVK